MLYKAENTKFGGLIMRSKMTIGLALGGTLAICGVTMAQPIVDGIDINSTEYGTPLWVNTVNPTGFGDNNLPGNGDANGSEIDAIYAVIQNDIFGQPTLYVGITGNVSSDFNKLDVFFDYNTGVGQNKLRGDNIDVDFNGLNRMGDDGTGNGLTFDSPFSANAYFMMTSGNYDCDLDLSDVFANFADLDNQTGGFLGQGTTGFGALSGGDNPFGVQATINNSNIAGVTDTDTTGSDLVTTGAEFAIPLSAFNNPAQDIRMVIFINGQGHDFLSNQISGGSPDNPLDNLGEPRVLDLNTITGDQFVSLANGGPGDCLTLAVANLKAGQQATFQITGGTPGAKAVTVYGLQPGQTKVVNVAGYCATFGIKGVSQSKVLGGLNKTFNNNGVISFKVPIPGNASGTNVLFQSAMNGTCPDECISNLLSDTVQ